MCVCVCECWYEREMVDVGGWVDIWGGGGLRSDGREAYWNRFISLQSFIDRNLILNSVLSVSPDSVSPPRRCRSPYRLPPISFTALLHVINWICFEHSSEAFY